MRFTRSLEAKVLAAVRERPERHVVMAASMYREDGSIVIYRDGLERTLHRYLYEQVIGPLERRTYLLPTCSAKGCVNPYHRKLATSPHPGRAESGTCPNGHRRTAANTLPEGRDRCLTCKQERLARRRKRERKARQEARRQARTENR